MKSIITENYYTTSGQGLAQAEFIDEGSTIRVFFQSTSDSLSDHRDDPWLIEAQEPIAEGLYLQRQQIWRHWLHWNLIEFLDRDPRIKIQALVREYIRFRPDDAEPRLRDEELVPKEWKSWFH